MWSSTALKNVDRAVLKTCKGWCCSSSAGRFEEHSQQCFHWDSKLGPEGKKYYGLPIFCQVWGGGWGGGGCHSYQKWLVESSVKFLGSFKKAPQKSEGLNITKLYSEKILLNKKHF